MVNGASFVGGGIVPGEIATIFGSNLTSGSGINLAGALPLATQLLNVEVKFNKTILAPLFAVDNVNGQQQINFQVPWELAGMDTASISVTNNGATGGELMVPVLAAQPGIFAYSAGGLTFGAILHADFQLVDIAHPAIGGETVLIYCTGLGAVESGPADGQAGNGQSTTALPHVGIGGIDSVVSFAGLAPGFVGLYQINVQIPESLSPGNQPVSIMLAGHASNTVLLPVK